jgi:serine/threonine-protein kinase
MGAVFLAVDEELGRQVALKVLPRDKARNPTLVKRFQAEARSAANLSHDHIVTLYEAGEADGYLFIALEYVEGTDVHALVTSRGPLPSGRTIKMIRQVASALDHAASRGIVHRDIKPSNLLIRPDGTIKLTDMGLARSIDAASDAGITRAGHTVGTVDYMPPEQARDSRLADVRSDIYSLGCTWHFMLTGKPPYPEGDLTNKLFAHAHRPIPDPRELNPKVPDGIVAVLNRMMAKDPASRYQTARELMRDLSTSALSQGSLANAVLAALEDDDVDPGDSGPVAPTPAPPTERRRDFAPGETVERERLKVEIDFTRLLPILLAVFGVFAVLWFLLRMLGG